MARREPHWVKLFLRDLERTGNVRIAAEGAGVDFSTAYQRRKRHAEFAERWEGVLGAFALRSEQDGGAHEWAPSTISSSGNGPPPSAGIPPAFPGRRSLEAGSARAGEDLVIRPDGKVIKGSEARWGKRAEETFLTELTVSANVRLAAQAAGFSTTAVYQRRLKSRHFTAAWDAAVETGKARVQAYLVEAASRTFDPYELPIGDGREIPKVSISEAINIAKLKAAGPVALGPDEEYDEDRLKEVRERILEKLQRLKERDECELGEAGWTLWDLPPRPGQSEGDTAWLPSGYRVVGPGEA